MEYNDMTNDQKLIYRLWGDLEYALVNATELGIWEPSLCDTVAEWAEELSEAKLLSEHDYSQAMLNVEHNRLCE